MGKTLEQIKQELWIADLRTMQEQREEIASLKKRVEELEFEKQHLLGLLDLEREQRQSK